MLKVKEIQYSKVFNLGDYENEKLGIVFEMREGDDPNQAMENARKFVEFNHNLNGIVKELEQCEKVMNDADSYTGRDIQRAKEKWNILTEKLNEGQNLLNA